MTDFFSDEYDAAENECIPTKTVFFNGKKFKK